MKKSIIILASLLAGVAVLSAHDMFLKLTSFYLAPNSKATVALYNGTFDKSENVISRDRMLDVSIVGPGSERAQQDTSQWRDFGTTTLLDIQTGGPGTYVIGVSTKARIIELSGKEFTDYLVHDGVLDMLEIRKKNGISGDTARELYSKHVKAVVQVGDARSDAYKVKLGYPIEIVPLQNPYALKVGELVYSSYAGFHGHDDKGEHVNAIETRTDANGIAKLKIEKAGQWFVRLIHMEEIAGKENHNYESNWATLTFEIK